MADIEIRCSPDVEFKELETVVSMPGYVSLELEEEGEGGGDNVWLVSFRNADAAGTARFSLMGQKTKNGHVLVVKKREEDEDDDGDDQGVQDLWAGGSEHHVRAKISDAGQDWKAFMAQEGGAGAESVGLADKLIGKTDAEAAGADDGEPSAKKQKKDRVPLPTEPWMTHIPPPPVALRNPKIFLPVKLTCTTLKTLRNGSQQFYNRQQGFPFNPFPITLNEANQIVTLEVKSAVAKAPPSKLPLAIALTWHNDKPNIAALKKAASKKAPLQRCQVKIAKKLAVMVFKTPEHAEKAFAAVRPLHSKSQILQEDMVERFLEGGV